MCTGVDPGQSIDTINHKKAFYTVKRSDPCFMFWRVGVWLDLGMFSEQRTVPSLTDGKNDWKSGWFDEATAYEPETL
jgi:hypothetical protein